jgi:predicted helicase
MPPQLTGPAPHPDLRSRQLPPKRPLPHQREAIKHVMKGFDGADRGQLIMACGTGKTLTALFIHEKLAAERSAGAGSVTVAVGPTLREWTANC